MVILNKMLTLYPLTLFHLALRETGIPYPRASPLDPTAPRGCPTQGLRPWTPPLARGLDNFWREKSFEFWREFIFKFWRENRATLRLSDIGYNQS